MFNIFLIEDDPVISGAIKSHLEAWDYKVYAAEDFKNITEQLAEVSPQLVLLDISLPFYSGYYWCKEIRKISTVPIIFISSASDNMNIVMAVNMGGDDFLAKPFDLSVLLAKVQAVLRRTYDFAGQSSLITHKGAVLNKDDNTLLFNGEHIPLTKNEYRILLSLMEKKGEIVSRDALMERLWETDSFVDENTPTVNVTRLRKKLERLIKSGGAELSEKGALPEPSDPTEYCYQELIRLTYLQKQSALSDYASKRRDTEDYYTLWAHQIKPLLPQCGFCFRAGTTRISANVSRSFLKSSSMWKWRSGFSGSRARRGTMFLKAAILTLP